LKETKGKKAELCEFNSHKETGKLTQLPFLARHFGGVPSMGTKQKTPQNRGVFCFP
jgi:hypothetical protein